MARSPESKINRPPNPEPRPLSKNFYERLGLKDDATVAEIKSAYMEGVRKFHPDNFQTNAAKKQGEEVTKSLNQARDALLNPYERQKFDDDNLVWDPTRRSRQRSAEERAREQKRLEQEKRQTNAALKTAQREAAAHAARERAQALGDEPAFVNKAATGPSADDVPADEPISSERSDASVEDAENDGSKEGVAQKDESPADLDTEDVHADSETPNSKSASEQSLQNEDNDSVPPAEGEETSNSIPKDEARELLAEMLARYGKTMEKAPEGALPPEEEVSVEADEREEVEEDVSSQEEQDRDVLNEEDSEQEDPTATHSDDEHAPDAPPVIDDTASTGGAAAEQHEAGDDRKERTGWYEKSSAFLKARSEQLSSGIRGLGANMFEDAKAAARGVAHAASHPIESVKGLYRGAESTYKYAAYFASRNESWDKKGEKVFKDFNRLVDGYNKLPPRQKVYLSVALATGTGLTSGGLSTILAAGMYSQRFVGGAGFYKNRLKGVDARAASDKHWLPDEGSAAWKKHTYVAGLTAAYFGATFFGVRKLSEVVGHWMGHDVPPAASQPTDPNATAVPLHHVESAAAVSATSAHTAVHATDLPFQGFGTDHMPDTTIHLDAAPGAAPLAAAHSGEPFLPGGSLTPEHDSTLMEWKSFHPNDPYPGDAAAQEAIERHFAGLDETQVPPAEAATIPTPIPRPDHIAEAAGATAPHAAAHHSEIWSVAKREEIETNFLNKWYLEHPGVPPTHADIEANFNAYAASHAPAAPIEHHPITREPAPAHEVTPKTAAETPPAQPEAATPPAPHAPTPPPASHTEAPTPIQSPETATASGVSPAESAPVFPQGSPESNALNLGPSHTHGVTPEHQASVSEQQADAAKPPEAAGAESADLPHTPHFEVNTHDLAVDTANAHRYLGAHGTKIVFGGSGSEAQARAAEWVTQDHKAEVFYNNPTFTFFGKPVPHLMRMTWFETAGTQIVPPGVPGGDIAIAQPRFEEVIAPPGQTISVPSINDLESPLPDAQ